MYHIFTDRYFLKYNTSIHYIIQLFIVYNFRIIYWNIKINITINGYSRLFWKINIITANFILRWYYIIYRLLFNTI